MQQIIGFAIIIGFGWLVIQILPAILPIIGYLIVGVIAIAIFTIVFGK